MEIEKTIKELLEEEIQNRRKRPSERPPGSQESFFQRVYAYFCSEGSLSHQNVEKNKENWSLLWSLISEQDSLTNINYFRLIQKAIDRNKNDFDATFHSELKKLVEIIQKMDSQSVHHAISLLLFYVEMVFSGKLRSPGGHLIKSEVTEWLMRVLRVLHDFCEKEGNSAKDLPAYFLSNNSVEEKIFRIRQLEDVLIVYILRIDKLKIDNSQSSETFKCIRRIIDMLLKFCQEVPLGEIAKIPNSSMNFSSHSSANPQKNSSFQELSVSIRISFNCSNILKKLLEYRIAGQKIESAPGQMHDSIVYQCISKEFFPRLANAIIRLYKFIPTSEPALKMDSLSNVKNVIKLDKSYIKEWAGDIISDDLISSGLHKTLMHLKQFYIWTWIEIIPYLFKDQKFLITTHLFKKLLFNFIKISLDNSVFHSSQEQVLKQLQSFADSEKGLGLINEAIEPNFVAKKSAFHSEICQKILRGFSTRIKMLKDQFEEFIPCYEQIAKGEKEPVQTTQFARRTHDMSDSEWVDRVLQFAESPPSLVPGKPTNVTYALHTFEEEENLMLLGCFVQSHSSTIDVGKELRVLFQNHNDQVRSVVGQLFSRVKGNQAKWVLLPAINDLSKIVGANLKILKLVKFEDKFGADDQLEKLKIYCPYEQNKKDILIPKELIAMILEANQTNLLDFLILAHNEANISNILNIFQAREVIIPQIAQTIANCGIDSRFLNEKTIQRQKDYEYVFRQALKIRNGVNQDEMYNIMSTHGKHILLSFLKAAYEREYIIDYLLLAKSVIRCMEELSLYLYQKGFSGPHVDIYSIYKETGIEVLELLWDLHETGIAEIRIIVEEIVISLKLNSNIERTQWFWSRYFDILMEAALSALRSFDDATVTAAIDFLPSIQHVPRPVLEEKIKPYETSLASILHELIYNTISTDYFCTKTFNNHETFVSKQALRLRAQISTILRWTHTDEKVDIKDDFPSCGLEWDLTDPYSGVPVRISGCSSLQSALETIEKFSKLPHQRHLIEASSNFVVVQRPDVKDQLQNGFDNLAPLLRQSFVHLMETGDATTQPYTKEGRVGATKKMLKKTEIHGTQIERVISCCIYLGRLIPASSEFEETKRAVLEVTEKVSMKAYDLSAPQFYWDHLLLLLNGVISSLDLYLRLSKDKPEDPSFALSIEILRKVLTISKTQNSFSELILEFLFLKLIHFLGVSQLSKKNAAAETLLEFKSEFLGTRFVSYHSRLLGSLAASMRALPVRLNLEVKRKLLNLAQALPLLEILNSEKKDRSANSSSNIFRVGRILSGTYSAAHDHLFDFQRAILLRAKEVLQPNEFLLLLLDDTKPFSLEDFIRGRSEFIKNVMAGFKILEENDSSTKEQKQSILKSLRLFQLVFDLDLPYKTTDLNSEGKMDFAPETAKFCKLLIQFLIKANKAEEENGFANSVLKEIKNSHDSSVSYDLVPMDKLSYNNFEYKVSHEDLDPEHRLLSRIIRESLLILTRIFCARDVCRALADAEKSSNPANPSVQPANLNTSPFKCVEIKHAFQEQMFKYLRRNERMIRSTVKHCLSSLIITVEGSTEFFSKNDFRDNMRPMLQCIQLEAPKQTFPFLHAIKLPLKLFSGMFNHVFVTKIDNLINNLVRQSNPIGNHLVIYGLFDAIIQLFSVHKIVETQEKILRLLLQVEQEVRSKIPKIEKLQLDYFCIIPGIIYKMFEKEVIGTQNSQSNYHMIFIKFRMVLIEALKKTQAHLLREKFMKKLPITMRNIRSPNPQPLLYDVLRTLSKKCTLAFASNPVFKKFLLERFAIRIRHLMNLEEASTAYQQGNSAHPSTGAAGAQPVPVDESEMDLNRQHAFRITQSLISIASVKHDTDITFELIKIYRFPVTMHYSSIKNFYKKTIPQWPINKKKEILMKYMNMLIMAEDNLIDLEYLAHNLIQPILQNTLQEKSALELLDKPFWQALHDFSVSKMNETSPNIVYGNPRYRPECHLAQILLYLSRSDPFLVATNFSTETMNYWTKLAESHSRPSVISLMARIIKIRMKKSQPNVKPEEIATFYIDNILYLLQVISEVRENEIDLRNFSRLGLDAALPISAEYARPNEEISLPMGIIKLFARDQINSPQVSRLWRHILAYKKEYKKFYKGFLQNGKRFLDYVFRMVNHDISFLGEIAQQFVEWKHMEISDRLKEIPTQEEKKKFLSTLPIDWFIIIYTQIFQSLQKFFKEKRDQDRDEQNSFPAVFEKVFSTLRHLCLLFACNPANKMPKNLESLLNEMESPFDPQAGSANNQHLQNFLFTQKRRMVCLNILILLLEFQPREDARNYGTRALRLLLDDSSNTTVQPVIPPGTISYALRMAFSLTDRKEYVKQVKHVIESHLNFFFMTFRNRERDGLVPTKLHILFLSTLNRDTSSPAEAYPFEEMLTLTGHLRQRFFNSKSYKFIPPVSKWFEIEDFNFLEHISNETSGATSWQKELYLFYLRILVQNYQWILERNESGRSSREKLREILIHTLEFAHDGDVKMEALNLIRCLTLPDTVRRPPYNACTSDKLTFSEKTELILSSFRSAISQLVNTNQMLLNCYLSLVSEFIYRYPKHQSCLETLRKACFWSNQQRSTLPINERFFKILIDIRGTCDLPSLLAMFFDLSLVTQGELERMHYHIFMSVFQIYTFQLNQPVLNALRRALNLPGLHSNRPLTDVMTELVKQLWERGGEEEKVKILQVMELILKSEFVSRSDAAIAVACLQRINNGRSIELISLQNLAKKRALWSYAIITAEERAWNSQSTPSEDVINVLNELYERLSMHDHVWGIRSKIASTTTTSLLCIDVQMRAWSQARHRMDQIVENAATIMVEEKKDIIQRVDEKILELASCATLQALDEWETLETAYSESGSVENMFLGVSKRKDLHKINEFFSLYPEEVGYSFPGQLALLQAEINANAQSIIQSVTSNSNAGGAAQGNSASINSLKNFISFIWSRSSNFWDRLMNVYHSMPVHFLAPQRELIPIMVSISDINDYVNPFKDFFPQGPKGADYRWKGPEFRTIYRQFQIIVGKWRFKMPHKFEDVNIWSNSISNRLLMISTVRGLIKAYADDLGIFTSGDNFGEVYNEKNLYELRYARVLRIQRANPLLAKCLSELSGRMSEMTKTEQLFQKKEQLYLMLGQGVEPDVLLEEIRGLSKLNELVASSPTGADLFKSEVARLQGIFYLDHKKFDEANNSCAEAITHQPHHWKAWNTWAKTLIRINIHQNHEKWVENAIIAFGFGLRYKPYKTRLLFADLLICLRNYNEENHEKRFPEKLHEVYDTSPLWIWLIWIPQFILLVIRNIHKCVDAVHILSKIAEAYPTAIINYITYLESPSNLKDMIGRKNREASSGGPAETSEIILAINKIRKSLVDTHPILWTHYKNFFQSVLNLFKKDDFEKFNELSVFAMKLYRTEVSRETTYLRNQLSAILHHIQNANDRLYLLRITEEDLNLIKLVPEASQYEIFDISKHLLQSFSKSFASSVKRELDTHQYFDFIKTMGDIEIPAATIEHEPLKHNLTRLIMIVNKVELLSQSRQKRELLTFLTSNEKSTKFIICAPQHDILDAGLESHMKAVFNTQMTRSRETTQRGISFRSNPMFFVDQHLVLMAQSRKTVSFLDVLDDYAKTHGIDPDLPLKLFFSNWSTSLANANASTFFPSNEMMIENPSGAGFPLRNTSIINEHMSKLIPHTVLKDKILGSLLKIDDYLLWRECFTRHYCAALFLHYLFQTEISFETILVSLEEGVVEWNPIGSYFTLNKNFHQDPMIIYQNVQRVLGYMSSLTVCVPHFIATAKALMYEPFGIRSHLNSFVSSEQHVEERNFTKVTNLVMKIEETLKRCNTIEPSSNPNILITIEEAAKFTNFLNSDLSHRVWF